MFFCKLDFCTIGTSDYEDIRTRRENYILLKPC